MRAKKVVAGEPPPPPLTVPGIQLEVAAFHNRACPSVGTAVVFTSLRELMLEAVVNNSVHVPSTAT